VNTEAVSQALRGLRPRDADRVDDWFSPAQRGALLHAITSTPRPLAADERDPATTRRRSMRSRASRRLRLLVLAASVIAAGVAVAVLILNSTVQTQPAQAAVSFRTAADGEIVATVRNPFAAEKQLDAAFTAHGLHITVSLVPVSPSLVGTVVYSSDNGGNDAIQTTGHGRCLTGGGGCPIGLKIPSDFTGRGYITLGRPAKAGESYDSTTSAFAPGEALQCSGLFGAQVSAAMSVLHARGLIVAQWRVANKVTTTAPAHNYVWQVDPMTARTVRVWTEPTPPTAASVSRSYQAGCPSAG